MQGLTMSMAVAVPSDRQPGWLLPSVSLARRELVRFVRQRNRVIGALLTPVVFWLLIGGGIGRTFHAPGVPGGDNFLEFFFPGTILMILLFTAIFSTISIIEDRREGFLQSVLVSPAPRIAIVLGKVLGGTVLAVGQAMLFLLIAPWVGIPLTAASFAAAVGVMLLLGFSLTALGFCIAWPMGSTQGFHAIMNLLLMPMWFLSGALFPATGSILKWVMALNPLTYGLAALRRALYPAEAAEALPGWSISLGVSAGFAVLMLLLATWLVRTKNCD